jgi:hypothetical protein
MLLGPGAFGQAIADRSRVGNRARQPVELRHHQGVAAAHGGDTLVETGACAVRSGETAISIDAVRCDAEFQQSFLLCGEVSSGSLPARRYLRQLAVGRSMPAPRCNAGGDSVS